MKPLVIAAAICALAGMARAQAPVSRMISAQSFSGQFVVSAPANRSPFARRPDLAGNTNLIELQPTLITVSAERIKQVLWRELGATDAWRGKIFIGLHPANSANDQITIASQRFVNGWNYHVDLPDAIGRAQFVRAIVQVLLLEMANRNAGQHSAEIPVWLGEGLTQQVLNSTEVELALPTPTSRGNSIAITTRVVSARRTDPLTQAHHELATRPPLTFEQLSWPAEDPAAGAADAYRSSAQLFVAGLLELKDGRDSLRALLGLLPTYYNWQLAFLQAFNVHFQRPLDIEKWWALRLVQFTGRDLTQTWTVEESWRRLDAVLRSPVQMRLATNNLPLPGEVTLQTIVRDWEPLGQTTALRIKASELEALRYHIGQDLVELVDDYRQTLTRFLRDRDKRTLTVVFGRRHKLTPAAEEALKRLDELDAKREALRPMASAATALKVEPGAGSAQ